ncbi:hypothetical protein [Treponema denticola]|nr:hypothetical protein [Treponema denticola]
MIKDLFDAELESIDVTDVEYLADIAEELASGCGSNCGGCLVNPK